MPRAWSLDAETPERGMFALRRVSTVPYHPGDFPHTVYSALYSLYDALDGDSWSDHTNWGTNLSLCHYAHVSCAPPQVGGVAAGNFSLLFAAANLHGTIPPGALTALGPFLSNLDLSNNPLLSGELPQQWSSMTALQSLALYSVPLLSGLLPTSLFYLRSLRSLSISGTNILSGTIPAQPVLPRLFSLTVSYNSLLSGQLPDFTGTPGLIFLNVASNPVLSGVVSTSIARLRNLTTLEISFNPAMSGTIPW